jgi:beta-lactamase regulating signal transducer with metallopeptidase domain
MQHLLFFAANTASSLAAAVWQGAALAVAVALILRLVPAIPAAVRSMLWTATFAAIVALHLMPVHPAAPARTAPQLHIAPFWSLPVAVLWVALSLFRAGQLLIGVLRLREIARRALPMAIPVDGMAETGNSGRRYVVCSSDDVDRPSVLGFFRPRILLPPSLLATLTPGELHQILLHETEHLRRADDWANLFQKLALVVFPLNPALAWVERRLCLERELACDDRVLKSTGEATGARKAYATCLTHLAEHSMLHRGMSLALGIVGNRARTSELSTRVHRLLSRPAPKCTVAQTRFATAALLFGIAGASAALAHAPSLISFAPAPAVAPVTLAEQPPVWNGPAARATLVKAIVPFGHPVQRKAVRRAVRRNQPNVIVSDWRLTRRMRQIAQPRVTLTLSTGSYVQPYRTAQVQEQVQQFVVPAVAYVPAYAAVRVPDGWIILQL